MIALPDSFNLIIALALMSLVPFLAVMGTSFIKISVVFSLLRNALGVQNIPPNIAMYALAMVFTIYIMAPVGFSIYEHYQEHDIKLDDTSSINLFIEEGLAPYREFLKKQISSKELAFFSNATRKLWPEKYQNRLESDSLLILLPAFTVSELARAFEIGFLLYLPFIAIDLIVSNILLALGMMMVSPITISLPFKVLLFILLDGWTRLTHALVISYA